MRRRDFLRDATTAAAAVAILPGMVFGQNDKVVFPDEKIPVSPLPNTSKYPGAPIVPEPHEFPAEIYFRRAKDSSKLTAEEEKHIPVITLPNKVEKGKPFEMKVSIGRTLHPMAGDHHIEWLILLINHKEVGRVNFKSSEFFLPELHFSFVLNEKADFLARISCNVHGFWEEMAQIPVF